MATNKSTKPSKPAKATPKTVVKSAKTTDTETPRLAKIAAAAHSRKPAATVPVTKKPAAPVVAASKSSAKIEKFNEKDLQIFRKELLVLRDRLTGQVAQMREESLRRDDEVNPEEDGTDAFDRLFALERAGNDQDIIFTIDESIRAIDEGKYGICDGCSSLIEKPRLHALPFAKNCIKCQSEMERGRNNGSPRRQVP